MGGRVGADNGCIGSSLLYTFFALSSPLIISHVCDGALSTSDSASPFIVSDGASRVALEHGRRSSLLSRRCVVLLGGY